MLREDRLQFCRVCTHQSFIADKGLICSITGSVASFEGSCTSYSEDEVLKQKFQSVKTTKTLENKRLSAGKRLLNHFLDLVLLYIVLFLTGIVIGIAGAIFSIDLHLDEMTPVTTYLVGFVILFIYFSIWEMLTGRTPAKYITKSKVVNLDGNKPSSGRILLRTLCRFIPFEAFTFIGDGTNGLHDKLSKTMVIDSRKNYFSDYE